MGPLNRGLLCTVCCAYALTFSTVTLAQSKIEASTNKPVQASTAETLAATELPDSPGTEWAKSQEPGAQDPGAQQNSTNSPTVQPNPGTQQDSAASAGQDQKPQRPVGTAAAEAPKVSGVTAAEPAGVAIAPAKQHRARAIVIKVGAIVGAGAALGAVVALSEATHSKPPGAH